MQPFRGLKSFVRSKKGSSIGDHTGLESKHPSLMNSWVSTAEIGSNTKFFISTLLATEPDGSNTSIINWTIYITLLS